MNSSVQIFAISGVPDIRAGDQIDEILGECLEASGGVAENDILCIRAMKNDVIIHTSYKI